MLLVVPDIPFNLPSQPLLFDGKLDHITGQSDDRLFIYV